MANKKITQLNSLNTNRGSSSLFNEDIFDMSIKENNTYLSTKVSFGELKDQISIASSGHTLASATHTDVRVAGDLQHGQALVWTGDNFTNEFASGGSGVDWEYADVSTGTHELTSNSNIPLEYNISDFLGDNINTSNIRGVYVKCWTNGTITEHGTDKAYISATFPNGEWEEIYKQGGNITDRWYNDIRTVLEFVPINANQDTISFKCTHGTDDYYKASYRIMGVQQTKQASLSPDFDVIHLLCTTTIDNRGYISEDSTLTPNTSAYISTDPTTPITLNLSSVFPIEIEPNVTKTVITNYSADAAGNTDIQSENHTVYDITVDWVNNTVNGFIMTNYGSGITALSTRIFTGTPSNITTYNYSNGTKNMITRGEPVFEIMNRNITKLPAFEFCNSMTTITNYKTVTTSNSSTNIPISGIKRFNEYVGGRGSNPHYTYGGVYITNRNEVMGWGDNNYQRFGITTQCYAPGNVLFNSDFNIIGNEPVKCYISINNVFVLTANGNVYGSGYNGRGALCPIDSVVQDYQPYLTKCSVNNVKKISMNNQPNAELSVHFLTNDGELYSSGYNGVGSLGTGNVIDTGTTVYHHTDICVGESDDNGDQSTIIDVVQTGQFSVTAVLLSNGKVKTTGRGSRGALGQGSAITNDVTEFATVPINDVVEIQGWGIDDSGFGGFIVKKSNDELHGWGDNTCRYINETDDIIYTPTLIHMEVERYWVHQEYCRLFLQTKSGELYAGGNNNTGSLGVGLPLTRQSTLRPVSTTTGLDYSKIIEIFGSDDHTASTGVTYIVCSDGIWAAGYNGNLQLGINKPNNQSLFQKMLTPLGVSNPLHQMYDDEGELIPFLHSEYLNNTAGYVQILDNTGGVYGCGYGWLYHQGVPNNSAHIAVLTKQEQYQ